MENFQEDSTNWATLGQPPEFVMKYTLLQKREGFIQASMIQHRSSVASGAVDASRTSMWLFALWLETVHVLEREGNHAESISNNIQESLISNNVNRHIDSFIELMKFLDKKKLIKWDNDISYDRTRVEEENRIKKA